MNQSNLVMEPMPWDSKFFKLKIGKLYVTGNESEDLVYSTLRQSDSFDLVYVFVEGARYLQIQDSRLKLVDEKLVYLLERNSSPPNEILPLKEGVAIKEYPKQAPNHELISLALQSGVHSRFFIDQNFEQEAYTNLYREWIARSTDRTIADKTFIAEWESSIVGFVTVKEKPQEFVIGLISVDQNHRSLGIGQQLLSEVSTTFFRSAAENLSVATQKRNKGACHFYEKNGFKLSTQTNIYHFWHKS